MTPVVEESPLRGFRGFTANLGFKNDEDDLVVIVSTVPSRSAAVFTRSRFAGPSVKLSRASAVACRSRGVVMMAGNANVATGPMGAEHATEVRAHVANLTGVPAGDLLIGSTGAIGRAYPMDVIRPRLEGLHWPFASPDFAAAAAAMMTGDTQPKWIHLRCGGATLVGIAKGGGIAEHDRTTLMAFFFSDAAVPSEELDGIFRSVIGCAFPALNIETDTATSDTAALFVNGLAGPVKSAVFGRALHDAASYLARMIAAENDEMVGEWNDGLAAGPSI